MEAGRRRTTRLLRLLLVAAVVAPLLSFGCGLWLVRDAAYDEAERRLLLTAETVREHARRVFDTHRLVAERVSDLIRGLTDEEIRAREGELHARLAAMIAELPQIQTIVVQDRHGYTMLLANIFPAPRDQHFRDREFYQVLSREPLPVFISKVVVGRLDQYLFFGVNFRRRDSGNPEAASGEYDGLINISVRPNYFAEAYAPLASAEDEVIALLRQDGEFLARRPGFYEPLPALQPEQPLRRAMATNPGVAFRSASPVDEREYLYVVQPVGGGYPVFVAVGRTIASITRDWVRTLATHGIIGFVLSAVVVAMILATMRQVAREQEATLRTREEAERRRAAEVALAHSQKIDALGKLTGGVAHDFNNLLTAIIGNIDLALQSEPEGRRRRQLENALRAAHRSAKITSQLLAFSRQQPSASAPTNLSEAVRSMLDLLVQAAGRTIAVECELAPDLPPVLLDVDQFEVAVLNLVVNARDAMPAGGSIVLSTSFVKEAALLPLDVQVGEYVVLAVSDSGEGMSDEVRTRVFEPFFTTKQVGRGAGLGLSMVHGFVKQSGGSIMIDSRPDAGTTVRLFFPALRQAPEGQAVSDAGDARISAGDLIVPVRSEL